MNYTNEFKEYATKHIGVTEYEFANWEQLQNSIYNPSVMSTFQGANASLTPYILEEREMRVTQMDIFSRLMMDRIIWLAGPVNDRMSTVVQAQLMFMDNLEVRVITLHVDSPGGSVKSGLSIVDVMNYISSDIVTINTGMAASMGSILLGAGTKGKRYMLPNSRVMLHQVSSGASGHVEDIKISLAEAIKYNDILFDMLGDYCGKTREQVLADCNRDNWLNSKEALAYGIIDGIVENKPKGKK
jgi:ATP-dependent Clp protease protease subunit